MPATCDAAEPTASVCSPSVPRGMTALITVTLLMSWSISIANTVIGADLARRANIVLIITDDK